MSLEELDDEIEDAEHVEPVELVAPQVVEREPDVEKQAADAAAEREAAKRAKWAEEARAAQVKRLEAEEAARLKRIPKKKERDPAAAAAAAEGVRRRREEEGLACKVCGAVFPSRKEVLKHIEKTGHVRHPEDVVGGLPDDMFFIPEQQRARHVKGKLLID